MKLAKSRLLIELINYIEKLTLRKSRHANEFTGGSMTEPDRA